MYKTAVYRLVNGGITHKKQQIYGKGDDAAIHRLSMHCRATAVLYINICCFTSDFRSLFNFSVLSLTLETVIFSSKIKILCLPERQLMVSLYGVRQNGGHIEHMFSRRAKY